MGASLSICLLSYAHVPLLAAIKRSLSLTFVCVANCAKWGSLIEWKIVLIIFPWSEQ